MVEAVQTDRLILKTLSKDDVNSFHAVWSDSEATQWYRHGPCKTIEESEEWMAGVRRSSEDDNRRSWLVYLTDVAEPDATIGILTLLRLPVGDMERPGQWELGYLFRSHAWGKGFATESCEAAMASLKADFPDHKLTVWAAVDIVNRKSLRVLAKLGFSFKEHTVFGGPRRFLGGDWRPHEILFFTKQL